ncbi:MAG: transglutaminase family protein [Gammaproteobacteria bacterium]|nr:transglutaminase family protein [Gammaproteobacteria bacterium]MDE2250026.1 transglutaminase family protein [Gammaproteobacteria bacterium]
MKMLIRHETLYRYESPARYCIQYLRLTPRADAGQRIVDWHLDMPGRSWRQLDAFGNVVHVMSVHARYDSLKILARGSVETMLEPGAPIAELSALPLECFLVPTRLTTPDATIVELAGMLNGATDTMQAVLRLMEQIRARVRYETGSTDVDHTAAESLAQGSGVCQDHAHILVSCARAAGLPARYVSGYIDAGDVSHVSSHAWADVWIAQRGWVSFDATHGAPADAAYCRLAVGRDYLDASPVRGMRQGGVGESLRVGVAVGAVSSAAERQQ